MTGNRSICRRMAVFPGLLLAGIGLIIIALSGCGGEADNWITVSGKVVDVQTQQPIASAWLALDDTLTSSRFTVTDTSGIFYFPLLPFSQFSLYAGKDGYVPGKLDLTYHGNDISDLIFELAPVVPAE